MKTSTILLSLNVCGAAAFLPQGPRAFTHVALQSTPSGFTYGNMNGDGNQSGSPSAAKDVVRADPPQGGPGMRQPGAPLQGGPKTASAADIAEMERVKNVWDTASEITVQGGSLRTWSVTSPYVEHVQVALKTDGRPLNANVELWHGPDNTPQKMAVYLEDGSKRSFNAVIQTPGGHNAVAIRNTGHLEFPLSAVVEADVESDGQNLTGLGAIVKRAAQAKAKIVQGGAVQTYPFEPNVGSVQVMLKTDGRPLNARIELLQGPNNNKQVVEVYTEDGMERPFFAVFETPGVGNVVRVVNTAPVEFPMNAVVQPFLVEVSPKAGGWDSEPGNFLTRQ